MTAPSILTLSLFSTLGATIASSVIGEPHFDPTLVLLGEELSDALAFDRVLGVLVRLLLIWLSLQGMERLIQRTKGWRLSIAHVLEAWAPTLRLTAGGLMVVVIIDAITPTQPEARALVAVGVILTVLWSAQAVLRNAAAGAVIIARRAVSVGEHLRVGEIAGRVISVSLRGVELEDADGSRTFIPGLLLHTETITHGPSGARASAVELTWRPCAGARARDPEEVRRLIKHLALLSPRRAPGTPVLVHQNLSKGEVRITMTPYERSESDALRLEVTRRLSLAFTAKSAKDGASHS